MEKLLHFVWMYRLLPANGLVTESGERIELIDPGVHNFDAGPDFFNAKLKIGGTLWVGNVEMHERASDWERHGHGTDAAYDNVVLHVCSRLDARARTSKGRLLPQTVLPVPDAVRANYEELLAEEAYPPCYRVVPQLPKVVTHAWLSALTVERLEEKMQRIGNWLERTEGDWERTFFITLARNFGFGVNADAFEEWAFRIPPSAVGKHRDNPFQVEAIFLGQAGLLTDEAVDGDRRDDYFARLQEEYRYLAHKFSLSPMPASRWRFARLRPQNFPHIRLSQLVTLYCRRQLDFSRLLEAATPEATRTLFQTEATPYWTTHYTFGLPHKAHAKSLQAASLNLLLINTAAPLLFAYGRRHRDEARCERAFSLLEATPAERNFITRSWERAGLRAEHAADSQAFIQLRRHYCERKDCLRCRFGCEYLRKGRPSLF